MVAAQEMEKPMDEEPPQLFMEACAVHGCLSLCSMGIDHDIPYQEFSIAGNLFHALIKGKREHISGSVSLPVNAVKVSHPPVIDKEYPEFSPVKVERCEKFQGVLFYFPEIYP